MSLYQAPLLFAQPVPAPPAGQEWVLKPTGRGGILVRNLTFRFTASAAVANRLPTIVATGSDGVFWREEAPAVVAAAGIVRYQAYDGDIPHVGGGGLVTLGWPAGGLWLPQGFTLGSLTTLLDVADQYDQVNAYIQELPSGPWFGAWPTAVMYAEPTDE